MKWFKHHCSDSMDNRLVGVMEEFGVHSGYACYFLLMEYCARKFEGEEPVFSIRMRTLRQVLYLSRQKVENFLAICSKFNLFSFEKVENLYVIKWPHLAGIADEYTRKKNKNIRILSLKKMEIKPSEEKRIDKIKLLNAIRIYGRYNPLKAKEFLGDGYWDYVKSNGGWGLLCQTYKTYR